MIEARSAQARTAPAITVATTRWWCGAAVWLLCALLGGCASTPAPVAEPVVSPDPPAAPAAPPPAPVAAEEPEAMEEAEAAAPPAPAPAPEKSLDDEILETTILLKLNADPRLARFEIGVAARGGQVVLTGTVASAEERSRAEALARQTDGVRSVKNLLSTD